MDRNVGGVDRNLRLGGGLALAAVGIALVTGVVQGGSVIGLGLILVGAILLVTGSVQYCPLNHLFGVDTCPRS